VIAEGTRSQEPESGPAHRTAIYASDTKSTNTKIYSRIPRSRSISGFLYVYKISAVGPGAAPLVGPDGGGGELLTTLLALLLRQVVEAHVVAETSVADHLAAAQKALHLGMEI
jgi:hypothetical protein